MKTNTISNVTPISKNEMEALLKETKETIATGILKNVSKKQTFGVIDLWRMQKKHKTLGSSTKW
ncbi:MAG: hypothetical protein H7258_09875 [Ferruginibacter sp.]|nr:hypothetical protein [Ferruginibacter sp.]